MLKIMERVFTEVILLLDNNQKFEEDFFINLIRFHEITHLKKCPRIAKLFKILFYINYIKRPI